jgi:acetolactate synthase-1/2/3 large subunit
MMLRTLLDEGVDVCFTNPGTSEMQFVAALDDEPSMRGVLTLFEGVATGAADGYGRLADKPASVLLHLGPGLGNGLANLHNARRAHTPMVVVVGDHASYHLPLDPPLASDIAGVARTVSKSVVSVPATREIPAATASAVRLVQEAPRGIATLIVPADYSWLVDEARPYPAELPRTPVRHVGDDTSFDDESARALGARALRAGHATAMLLGASAMREAPLRLASMIAQATGARLLSETFPALIERGAGRVEVERLAYFAEFALPQLEGVTEVLLVGASEPVSFFAYPGKEGRLVPPGATVRTLLAPGGRASEAIELLEDLADRVGARSVLPRLEELTRTEPPTGTLTASKAIAVVASLLPEGAIVSDESNTASLAAPAATRGSHPHRWMTLTGGAIGQGMPLATGAAIADPSAKVISLEADGSAMYTLQALWTQAREGLDVITVIFNNRSYAILDLELGRVGVTDGGKRARTMLELTPPDLGFVALARGMGVDACRVETCEELVRAFSRATQEPGPHLIELILPEGIS